MGYPAARYDSAGHRYAPHEDYADFVGFDFTGATLKAQVRASKNGGPLLVDLAQVTSAAAEGVRLESVTVDEGISTSRIAWRINETTMEATPLDPADPDADVVAHFDLHITPAGGLKYVALAGTFTIKAGVTQ